MPDTSHSKQHKHSWLLKLVAGIAFVLVIGNAGGSAGSGYFSLTELFDLSHTSLVPLWQTASWLFTVALFYGYYTVYGSAQQRVMSNLGHFIHCFMDAMKEQAGGLIKLLTSWTKLKTVWRLTQEKYDDYKNEIALEGELKRFSITTIENKDHYRENRLAAHRSRQQVLADLKQSEAVGNESSNHVSSADIKQSLKPEKLSVPNQSYYELMRDTYKKYKNNAYLIKQIAAQQAMLRQHGALRDTQEKGAYLRVWSDLKSQAEKSNDFASGLVSNPQSVIDDVTLRFHELCDVRKQARLLARETELQAQGLVSGTGQEQVVILKDILIHRLKQHLDVIANDAKSDEEIQVKREQAQEAWEKEVELIKREWSWERAVRHKEAKKLSSDASQYKKLRGLVRRAEYDADLAAFQLAGLSTQNRKKQISLQAVLRADRQSFDNELYVGFWQQLFKFISYPIAFFAALANGARGYFGVLAIAIALSSPAALLVGVVFYGMLSSFNSSISLTAVATVEAFKSFGRSIDRDEITLRRVIKASPKLLLNTIACLGSAAFIFVAVLTVLANAATIGLVVSNPVTFGLALGAAVFTFFAAFSLYAPHISLKPFKKLANFWRRTILNKPHADERPYTMTERLTRMAGLMMGLLGTVAAGLIAKVGFVTLLPLMVTHIAIMSIFPPMLVTGLVIGLAVINALVVGALLAPAMYKALGRIGRPANVNVLGTHKSEELTKVTIVDRSPTPLGKPTDNQVVQQERQAEVASSSSQLAQAAITQETEALQVKHHPVYDPVIQPSTETAAQPAAINKVNAKENRENKENKFPNPTNMDSSGPS